MLKLRLSQIEVPPYRQRTSIGGEALAELMRSIEAHGLLHPLVVRPLGNDRYALVAGERRLQVIANLAGLAARYRFGGEWWEPEFVPCVSLGDLPQLEAEEAEYEENVRRVDLTWQERAAATARLAELRAKLAEARNEPAPTVGDLAVEIRGSKEGSAQENTRREIVLAQHLSNPQIQAAKSLHEAWNILTREDAKAKHEALAKSVGATFGKHSHTLVNMDCVEWVATCKDETFDVVLTDPPYGMGADEFGDFGGRAVGPHGYKDSPEVWQSLITALAKEWYRITKERAHLYVFCDIDGFWFARKTLAEAGWWVHRTPIVVYKLNGMRVPWPSHGPQRKWEMVLYAVKGKKPVTHIYPDVIETRGAENLGHAAQKPVDVYVNLLKRSCVPGNTVLDCFGGSGTILEACHQLKCIATYVEVDPASYGLAVKRLEGL